MDIRLSPKRKYLFLFVFFCTVTDFSGEDKAGVKFCTVVQGVLGSESPIFGNFVPLEAQNLTNRLAIAK